MLGEGILKGMAETARNFFGSYVSKDRLTTVEYPEQRIPTVENARVFPFLVYDGADWEAGMRCVACQICEKECPPKCIYIDKSKDKKPDYVGKAQFYPARFDIDISVCMSCQICVEVCPFEAIKMDTQFELATADRFGGLLLDRQQLARSNEYYHAIHPTEASEVDARLAEEKAKVEAKAKAAADAATAKAAAAAQARSNLPKEETSQWPQDPSSQISTRSLSFSATGLWDFLPAALRPAAGVVLAVIAIVCVFPGLFALTTVFERKGLGRIQNRLGPNRVGPFGLFQPIADGIKSLTKEDIVPFSAERSGAFSGAAGAGGYGLHGLRGIAHGPQHGAGRHGFRPAVLLRHGRGDGAFGLHGRLVEPQQVFAAGRHARRCADDQLRGGAAAFEPCRW